MGGRTTRPSSPPQTGGPILGRDRLGSLGKGRGCVKGDGHPKEHGASRSPHEGRRYGCGADFQIHRSFVGGYRKSVNRITNR